MLNIDQIKKLWILDLIIQSGSLKRAAQKAKVSPSAISQSLSTLEKSVGKPLVIRQRGTIEATPEALALLGVVRPAFDVFDRLQGTRETPQLTWLSFGTYESIAVDVLPGLLVTLRERMPKLRLNLRISRTNHLLTMVRKGELCSALVVETDDLDRFTVREIAHDTLGFFVSNKHPIAELGWRAVDRFGFASLAPGSNGGHPRYFTKFMKQVSSARPLILSDSFETLRAAAAAGTVVSVLPHRVARRRDDLLEIAPPGSKGTSGLHKICIVSQLNCDPEEIDFLAAETARFLN